ncbi:unnamed protein product [Mytilus coruscus]|uniref:Uncharacterized protein n=1 Tax=Mytilus coruscus TaxID=42192 RepID=A0A6J8BY24_MYTCO|nr:unnamed protein product [Mytilus coruscus]
MAEEFIILDPVVENCNVFQDQAIVVKDDGSLQLIHTGAPSSSQATRLNSVPKRATVEKNKKGVEPNYVPFTASVEVNQQRPDLLAQYNEQLINNQKLYFEQKAINELTKSVIEIKNAVLKKTADPIAPMQLINNKRGKSPNTFYDSVSEEESKRDYESSQEDEEDMAEEPPEKRMKVTMKMSKMEKMKRVENILSKKPKLGSAVHEEIAKIINQGAESAVDHKNKEVQELVDKFVRPENYTTRTEETLQQERKGESGPLEMDTHSNSNVSTLLNLNCLHNTTDNFVAGKIAQYSETWKTITSDRNLLNIILEIRYGDLLKQTRPGYQLPEIFIEAFKPDFRICVVHTLHEYLERTNKLRFNNTQLFLSFQKPYKPVKNGTIAKWIKQVLILAGIDMTIFTPHSTRGAATSYVSGRIPIATILRTAGWRKDSVFRKFYQRPITNDSSFSKEILLAKGK